MQSVEKELIAAAVSSKSTSSHIDKEEAGV